MLREKAVEQDQQLSELQQTAMLCDQLKEEARQASKHASTCSKETEVSTRNTPKDNNGWSLTHK